nr:retrovirus-related Pol polyprotein from transposon TNT 1-94 [Tanacetum cinerariifolium]
MSQRFTISQRFAVSQRGLSFAVVFRFHKGLPILTVVRRLAERTVTVAAAKETVGSQVVQYTGIWCFNCKEFGHFYKEYMKPKRVKDYTYHKEKMLLCKQAKKGVLLQAEQADWLEDMDEEIDEQELEAHYSYMAKIHETELETYKTLNDRTLDYDKLERKLNETHGLLAQKEIDIKEGLKLKAYEISVVKEKHDEFVPDREETLTLEKESRSKLNKDSVKPSDYTKQNSLYENFKPASQEYHDQLVHANQMHEAYDGQSKAAVKYPDQQSLLCRRPQLQSLLGWSICDADLKVAFRKSTFFVRNLQGNSLVTGNHGSDLYIISLQETTSSTPICFIAKASLTQAWLWHPRLSHLNFDYINLLSKKDIKIGLPKLKYAKDQLCSSCELSKTKRSSFKTKDVPSFKGWINLLHMDLCGPIRVESINGKKYILVIVEDYSRYTWTFFLRTKDETPEFLKDFLKMIQCNLQAQVNSIRTDRGTKFLNKTLHAYFKEEGIKHQTSTPRTPKQNGIIERQNRTLVEAARTMLSASKLPLFFWAEAIATACFTQNRSTIIPTHEKTAYHIIDDRKPLITHILIFGCTCYLTRDGENLDKMKKKGSVHSGGILHSAPDYDNSGPAPQLQNVSSLADTTAPLQQELDLLFGPLYDEFLTAGTSSVNKSSSPTDNSKQQDTPPTTNIQSSTEPTTPTTNVNAKENINNQVVDTQFQQKEFFNPFCTPVREVAESFLRNIDNSNRHTFYQPHDLEYRWTKDHPLEQVHGNL